MSFFKTLSEKLGFIADESDDDRNDDELEDGEIQDEEDEEEEEDARPSVSYTHLTLPTILLV